MSKPSAASEGAAKSASPAAGLPWWATALLALLAIVAVFATVRLTTAASQIATLTRERQAALDDKARVDHDLSATRKQVEDMKGLLSLTQADLKKVQEDAKSAGAQMTQLNDKARALEAEVGKLNGELQAARADAEAQRQRAAGLEQELTKARSDVQAAMGDGQKLRTNAAAAEKAKTDAEGRSASLEREVEGLTKRLLEAQRIIDDLRKTQSGSSSTVPNAPIAQ